MVKKSVTIATIQNVILLIPNLARRITISIVILIIKRSAIPIMIKSVTRCIRMCAILYMIPSAIQPTVKSVTQIIKRFVNIMDTEEDMVMITIREVPHMVDMDTTITDMVTEDMDTMHPNVIKYLMKSAIAIPRSIAQNIPEKYVINIQTKNVNKSRRKNATSIQSNTVAHIQFTNAMKFLTKCAIKSNPNVVDAIVEDVDIIRNNIFELLIYFCR